MQTLQAIAATLILASLALPAPAAGTPSVIRPDAVTSSADDYNEAKQKLDLQLSKDLADVAKYCEKKKWLTERDRIYGLVLELDPSHSKARRALKYKKTRKGEWEQDDEYRPPRNKGRVDLDAVQEKEQKCHSKRHDAWLKLLDKFEESLGEARSLDELRAMLASFPKSDEVRQRLGYVEGWEGKPWVLPETKRSRERRKALTAQATRLRKEAPEATDSPYLEWEGDLGVDWVSCVRNDRVRVLSSVSKQEATAEGRQRKKGGEFANDRFTPGSRHSAIIGE